MGWPHRRAKVAHVFAPVDRAGSGAQKISLQKWRRSALPEVLFQLDEEGDINLVRDFFSYNHFYVIWRRGGPRAAAGRRPRPGPPPGSAAPTKSQTAVTQVGEYSHTVRRAAPGRLPAQNQHFSQ